MTQRLVAAAAQFREVADIRKHGQREPVWVDAELAEVTLDAFDAPLNGERGLEEQGSSEDG